MPWKPVTLPEKKVKFGVMWDDGPFLNSYVFSTCV